LKASSIHKAENLTLSTTISANYRKSSSSRRDGESGSSSGRMKDSGYNYTVDNGILTWSAICERLAAIALVLKVQQEELRTPLVLQREISSPVDGMRNKLASAEGLHLGKDLAQHQNQVTKMSEAPSTKVTEIRAWWKANGYHRDKSRGIVKEKSVAVPAAIVARAEPLRPRAQDPATPDGHIWQCAVRGAEEHEKALMAQQGVVRHEDESESNEEVQMRLLSDVFDAVPESMSQTLKKGPVGQPSTLE
jgi:hypothetical protein